MIELLPGTLWLGNAMDARDLTRLHDVGIRALVDLAIEETPPKLTRDLVYCRFPIHDGTDNPREILRAAVETLLSFILKKVPTLVFCGAGMSRSPCVAAAALALSRDASFDDTLLEVVAGQPHDVSPRLWADVKRMFDKE